MMNNVVKSTFVALLLGISSSIFSQNVGINTTGTAANSSAQLDLNTGNTFTSPNGKGLLIPNVALTDVNDAVTIASPATSLMVYVPSGSGLTPAGYYYNSGTPGSPVWQVVVNGSNTTNVFDHCTTLVNNTATGIVTISLPAGSSCGGMVNLAVYATNGTDYQSHTETLHFSAVNKAGTYTSQIKNEGDASTDAFSTGTIGGLAFAVSNGVNSITLTISANSNLAGLTSIKACYVMFEYSGKTITEL